MIPNLPGHVLGNLPRMPLPTANPGVLGTAPGVPGPGMLPMGVQQLPPGQACPIPPCSCLNPACRRASTVD